MGTRELGFGVVGLGMGKHHCLAVKNAEDCRLVAVCDLDPERLNPAAEEYRVKAYSSYAEMLQDEEIDVINIATPSGMHADMAMTAVAAGKHLVIEKPADIDVTKIKTLVQAVADARLKATGIFQLRTDPLNKRIKAAVENGRLGRIIGVHAILPSYRMQSYFEGKHGTWRGTWAMDGGGSLMNQGVHMVDLIQWLAGRVKSVFGKFGVYAHDIEAEDKTAACLHFQNGALGTLSSTTAAYGGVAPILLIHGDKGTIHKAGDLQSWKLVDDEDGREEAELMRYYGPKNQVSEGEALATDPTALSSTGHQFQIEDLAAAIREDRDPFITLESAIHAVEIINAVYESGRMQKEVFIPA